MKLKSRIWRLSDSKIKFSGHIFSAAEPKQNKNDESCAAQHSVMFVFADGGHVGTKAEDQEVQEYRVKCLNNLATTQMKLEQFNEALHTSRDVLTLEPNNVKALFRAGKVGGGSLMSG